MYSSNPTTLEIIKGEQSYETSVPINSLPRFYSLVTHVVVHDEGRGDGDVPTPGGFNAE